MRSLSCFSAILLGSALYAQGADLGSQPYHLRFFHTHTGERLDVVYRIGDQYIPEALDQLDHFLRDHRTGDIHHYDPRLFDLLNDLTASVGRARRRAARDLRLSHALEQRVSPYSHGRRCSAQPAYGSGGHRHSAAWPEDFRVSRCRTGAASGGVGYYAKSDFIHVDVGRVRRW